MTGPSEELERLIVRQLDGELNDDEQLGLNRMILRDPDARRMLDEYRQIDELASEVLLERMSEVPVPANSVRPDADALKLPKRGAGSRGAYSRWWWLLPAAAAAVLATPIALRVMSPAAEHSAIIVKRDNVPVETGAASRSVVIPTPVSTRAVQQAGALNDRAIDHNAYYVVGDDGRIYLIERESLLDIKQSKVRPTVQPAGGL